MLGHPVGSETLLLGAKLLLFLHSQVDPFWKALCAVMSPLQRRGGLGVQARKSHLNLPK